MISLEKLKEFREHILDLAIRGKLVDQRPEEGTAEDLYLQIQEEKSKLIKEGKLKKEKTLAPIEEDEIPFYIPDSWMWVRISDCIQVNPSVNFNDESEVSFIPMTNIEAGYKSAINLSEVKLWKDVKKNFSKFQNEDVIVAKITPCFQNRKSAIVTNLVNGYGAGTTELNILRTGELIDNLFILYFVKTHYFINYGINHFSGTVGQQRFGGDSLKQTLLPLPPLAEQKRIVAKVESYLSVIEKAEDLLKRKVDLDGQIKEKILQMAIQGKLVEQRPEEGTAEDLYQQIQEEKQNLIKEGKLKKEKPLAPIADEEIPFDIPENWKWARVGSIGAWGAGSTPSRTNSSFYGGDIPWLKTGDLTDGDVDTIPEKITQLALDKCSLKVNPVGSVLIAMYGATIGKLGILTVPATTNQACCACSVFNGMFNKYLFYFLMSRRDSFTKIAVGGAQPNISKEKIVNSLIPLPPLSEQKRIVAKVEELLALCDKLKLK